jgi:hypothetical protein
MTTTEMLQATKFFSEEQCKLLSGVLDEFRRGVAG